MPVRIGWITPTTRAGSGETSFVYAMQRAFGREARQRTFNPRDAGSIPAGPTSFNAAVSQSDQSSALRTRRMRVRVLPAAPIALPHPVSKTARKNSSQTYRQRERLLSPPWCAHPENWIGAYRGAGTMDARGCSSAGRARAVWPEVVSSTLAIRSISMAQLGRAIG